MIILTPFLRALGQTTVLRWDGGEMHLTAETESIDLTHVPHRAPFTLLDGEDVLLRSARVELAELAQSVRVAESATCLEHVDFRPVMRSSVFYRNDPQITVVTRYFGVRHDCPMIISWAHGGRVQYGNLVVIPRAECQDGVRAHAHGVYITSNVQKGEWEISYRLITGEEVLRSQVHLLDRDRGDYGRVLCAPRS